MSRARSSQSVLSAGHVVNSTCISDILLLLRTMTSWAEPRAGRLGRSKPTPVIRRVSASPSYSASSPYTVKSGPLKLTRPRISRSPFSMVAFSAEIVPSPVLISTCPEALSCWSVPSAIWLALISIVLDLAALAGRSAPAEPAAACRAKQRTSQNVQIERLLTAEARCG